MLHAGSELGLQGLQPIRIERRILHPPASSGARREKIAANQVREPEVGNLGDEAVELSNGGIQMVTTEQLQGSMELILRREGPLFRRPYHGSVRGQRRRGEQRENDRSNHGGR